jgi:hypothetical protein
MGLGKPQHPVRDGNGLPYEVGEVDQAVLKLISEFTGGNPVLLRQTMHLMPYFTLFHTMYVRAVLTSKGALRKSPLTNMYIDNEDKDWGVDKLRFNKEYNRFVSSVSKTQGIDYQTAADLLISQNMGPETRDRFYQYFTGGSLPSDVRPGTGSCAWPLGCVQNIMDFDPPAEKLGREEEHGRPHSLRPGDSNQRMCIVHNRWKGDNLLFDVIGVLYCIFGEGPPAED